MKNVIVLLYSYFARVPRNLSPWHTRPLRWEGKKKTEPISDLENWVRISLSGAVDETKSEPEAPASVTCLSMNFTRWSSEK